MFDRKTIAVVLLILTYGSASADPLLRVFAIRGFAGVAFSRGMNGLCEQVASIPRVACTVEDFFDESDIQSRAFAAMEAGQFLAFVGHSMGGHAALRIAGAMKGNVPLIVTIDPNWFPTPPRVPQNAEIVLNYYQDYDLLGRATLQPSPEFRGKLQQFRRGEPHVLIDHSPEIHAEIINYIRKILDNVSLPRAAPRRSR